MSTRESNHPDVVLPLVFGPGSTLRTLGNTFCSSFVFIFSFLLLGSLVDTFSFTAAFTYTREMLIEHLLLLLVPIFALYASMDALSRFVLKTRKPVFWSILSGTASFLLFNRMWTSTQGVVDLLRKIFHGIGHIDHVRMMLLPVLCALTLEFWGILFLPRLLTLLPKQFRNTS